LRRLMGVADQIVASRFSSIDLSNKAGGLVMQTSSIGMILYKIYLTNIPPRLRLFQVMEAWVLLTLLFDTLLT
ncbi:hypothetical protein, partial [Vibrio sp. Sgm 5]|uniref:hypothetical protein n=1 Tax=Vibrio sp. Sgm 5 TaxID=2994387 RepID=UPI002248D9A1